MKIFFFTVFLLICASLMFLSILAKNSKTRYAPGLVQGILKSCPNKPNCVCSELKDEGNNFIDPIIIPKNNTIEVLPIIKQTIEEMDGIVQTETDDYIAATFSSTIFGFVDDLEVRLDWNRNVIHLRSASRVGYSDGGINQKRTIWFKKLYAKNFKTANNYFQRQ